MILPVMRYICLKTNSKNTHFWMSRRQNTFLYKNALFVFTVHWYHWKKFHLYLRYKFVQSHDSPEQSAITHPAMCLLPTDPALLPAMGPPCAHHWYLRDWFFGWWMVLGGLIGASQPILCCKWASKTHKYNKKSEIFSNSNFCPSHDWLHNRCQNLVSSILIWMVFESGSPVNMDLMLFWRTLEHCMRYW